MLTRSGLFPPEASKGASQLILNCTLPALLFSKIVVSFTPDNIQVIGPIIIVSSLVNIFRVCSVAYDVLMVIRMSFRLRYSTSVLVSSLALS